jgi:hypothetical protein
VKSLKKPNKVVVYSQLKTQFCSLMRFIVLANRNKIRYWLLSKKVGLHLIGATTENPSFEVIPALLSRCQVYILNSFSKEI